MNATNLDHFRRALAEHKDRLSDLIESTSRHQAVCLGGAARSKMLELISEVDAALERINQRTFGKCTKCEGNVERERLEADFTCSVCLSHYSDAELRSLERELELVSRVQKDLLPCKTPALPGIEIAAHLASVGLVGGDYYDFFDFRNGSRGFAIADVMDKGLPASMMMSNLQASLRILGPETNAPDALANRLNTLFRHNLNLIKFISLVLVAIDTDSGALTYCNAGHHPALWVQGASKSKQWLDPTGPALGLTNDPEYRSETINFDVGDLFVFYTDGLIEAGSRQGREFGEARLASFVAEHVQDSAAELLNGLLESARKSAGDFHDDVTLVVLKIL